MNLVFAPVCVCTWGSCKHTLSGRGREVAGTQGFLNVRLALGTGGLVCLQATRSSYPPSPGPQECLGRMGLVEGDATGTSFLDSSCPLSPTEPRQPRFSYQTLCFRACCS